MAVFAYSAAEGRAAAVRGTITADSPRQARDQLRSRGLVVHEIAAQEPARQFHWTPFKRRGRHAAKVGGTIRELSTLLGAGIPLLESFDALANQHKGAFRASLLMVREQVAAGSSLAEAMREQPEIFDDLSVQMVTVGEDSGTLDVVLNQLADFSEKYQQFKDKVITSLMYPMLVLGMSVIVSMFLMTVVVPMLLDNLLAAGQPLPWPTVILKTMSDTVRTHGWWLAIVGIGTAIAVASILRTERGKLLWHRLLLRLPIFGTMTRKQEIARIALVVSTLMKSGIVFLQALETAAKTTKNLVIGRALLRGRDAVQAGRDIGEALAPTGIFPELAIQIFTVGQQTGKLEEMLERLAENYERQVNSLAGRLATALEPLLIVFLSLFVGFILFATILPILEAGNVL
jgi:general secretion pathway protein F